MITPCLTIAQKKELDQARSIIKSGKDFNKAEQLMTDLLKDAKNKDNKKIYITWFDAVRACFTAANERFYLKQTQDTAEFFDLNRRMFAVLEKLDSVEMHPNKKGRVDIEYRSKHAEILNTYRPNLFNAGTYFMRKGDYQKAFDYFEIYIDCDRQPIFTGRNYQETDKRMPEAAYWATFSGYKLNDALRTLRYRELALRDSSKASFTLQYIAEARQWLKDREFYVQTLEEGFSRFPTFSYFFPRLLDAYTQDGNLDKALETTNIAIAACDTCDIYYFAKATTLLRMGHYEECINVSEHIIEVNNQYAEAYFNIGTCYINLALQFDENKDKKLLRQFYQKARPYMERYRKLEPEAKEKWGPALYRIYLNLNMGKQFDEIDRLLK